MSELSTHYPEEYQIGFVHFLGKKYKVTPDVLIPRLETESLIKRAKKLIQENHITSVVDIGSGSGIIGSSLSKISDDITFIDISEKALQIARDNFEYNFPDKHARFIVSDLLGNYTIRDTQNPILFATNLPYIKDADWENMSEDTRFEPKLALFGWEIHGFELYEKLFTQIITFSETFHNDIYIVFEFWFDQRIIAETTLQKYSNWEYQFFADYAGIERFGQVRIPFQKEQN